MFRKKGLEKSLAVFVLAIGLILFYSWNFAANILYRNRADFIRYL